MNTLAQAYGNLSANSPLKSSTKVSAAIAQPIMKIQVPKSRQQQNNYSSAKVLRQPDPNDVAL